MLARIEQAMGKPVVRDVSLGKRAESAEEQAELADVGTPIEEAAYTVSLVGPDSAPRWARFRCLFPFVRENARIRPPRGL